MSCTPTIPNVTLSENSFYVGINLQDILYGIELVLYFKTMYILGVRRGERRMSDMFYGLFSTVMFLLITTCVASKGTAGQRMWILNANYPGGPLAYAEAHISGTFMAFAMTTTIILQQMTDGFMVHRCRILWDSLGAVIVPVILWLTNLVLAVLACWDAAMPSTTFFGVTSTTKLGLAYSSISVFLNATLTSMIFYRLVHLARRDQEQFREENASPYFSVVGLVVESMLLYTLSSIAFFISYGIGSGTRIAFSCLYTLMMCISPQMLILRVAEGRAWKKDRIATSMAMFFPRNEDTTSYTESGAAIEHLQMSPIQKMGEDSKGLG